MSPPQDDGGESDEEGGSEEEEIRDSDVEELSEQPYLRLITSLSYSMVLTAQSVMTTAQSMIPNFSAAEQAAWI
ncbi:hypothetical protein LI328DRAFT_149309 [Trichoderma asperelloides]|nr:hypothetical protein LI328DRAFT_149309 [Trichoderma asperelloides]